MRAASTPVATSALNSRAPSTCTGSPAPHTSSSCSTGQHRPPDAMCVFSTTTATGLSWWCSPASIANLTARAGIVPSSSSSGSRHTPLTAAAAPSS